jgi:predicted nucleic acid-binding Zn ribbon protein
VDDWEQHFVEKSRRRFEKERHDRRRSRTGLALAALILVIVVIGAVLGLTVWE